MLRDKVTKRIDEIKTDFNPERFTSEKIMSCFKALKLSESFSEFNKFKTKGYSVKLLLSLLVCIVVRAEKTVNSALPYLQSLNINIGKDSFYRLKNREKLNWRWMLWYISEKFLQVTTKNDTSEEKSPHYLIFDDTTIGKSGRKMEFMGRVWDHVKHQSILGYKILVMMYWDGKSQIPLDFSVHREKGKNESKPYGMSKKEYANSSIRSV